MARSFFLFWPFKTIKNFPMPYNVDSKFYQTQKKTLKNSKVANSLPIWSFWLVYDIIQVLCIEVPKLLRFRVCPTFPQLHNVWKCFPCIMLPTYLLTTSYIGISRILFWNLIHFHFGSNINILKASLWCEMKFCVHSDIIGIMTSSASNI